jgi:hypothetical protein
MSLIDIKSEDSLNKKILLIENILIQRKFAAIKIQSNFKSKIFYFIKFIFILTLKNRT